MVKYTAGCEASKCYINGYQQLHVLGRYGPWQKPNVMFIADINNKSPLKIYNESRQKILPGGTIFNQ